jgi:hypothetical protein
MPSQIIPRAFILIPCCAFALLIASSAGAASKDLGRGFRDLGVCAPISNHRGYVATVDGHGRDVVLAWLMDHRGGYELLMIDALTGKTEQFPMPFKVEGDSPYASILSRENKFYTHFQSHFVEFDPSQRKFTFSHETTPQMAMSMTEDGHGVIWSATYPQCGVVSFNPKTKAFHDYGHVYKQDWNQYPRSIAADDAGWIYIADGMTATQLLMLDPRSGKVTPVLEGNDRKKGTATVYPDKDGKVYGKASESADEQWYELYKGTAHKIAPGQHKTSHPKPIITGSQALAHKDFPDGRKIASLDLVNRKLITIAPDGKAHEVAFDYKSEGAIVMGAQTSPDGTIGGGTTFPMRFFHYDPKHDELTNTAAYGQWNTTTVQGSHFFAGGYPGGFLLDYDPSQPWVPTVKDKAGCNPLFLTDCDPELHRPTITFAHPDGHTLIMAGTPQYGYTGGGLLFWDRSKQGKDAASSSDARTLLSDSQLIPDQSTESLVALDGGKRILGGTTTSPGTGGQKKASQAELYILDFASKKIEWHAPLLPGVQEYTSLAIAPGGLVYGVADSHIFFVFDPAKRQIVHKKDTTKTLGKTAYQQGPRIFVKDPRHQSTAGESDTYMLLKKGIVRIDPKTHALKLIAASPVPAEVGGDYLDGNIYFASGSHLYSYQLK